MKKFIAAASAAAVSTVGLVAFSAAPSHAEPSVARCAYAAPQCIDTEIKTKKVNTKYRVKVKANMMGNASPTGTVTIQVTKPSGRVVEVTYDYNGQTTNYDVPGLNGRPGTYKIKFVFRSGDGSVYNNATKTQTFIKRR